MITRSERMNEAESDLVILLAVLERVLCQILEVVMRLEYQRGMLSVMIFFPSLVRS